MLGKVWQGRTCTTSPFLLRTPTPAALKFLPEDTDIPWQRVIGSSGTISSRGPGTNGAQRQREALEAEGVEVTAGRTGELRVSFETYGWFPDAIHAAEAE